jgi:V/A-type H+-transporting ATPase subunit E
MNDKLQELTNKIYQEGISKGKHEAEKIREEAEKKADEIISNAKKEAEKIRQEAVKKAEEDKKNMMAELKLAARQAVNSLKQKISELIQSKSIKEVSTPAFKDQEFINEVIITMVRSWSPETGTLDLTSVLPQEKQKEIDQYFNHKARELLDKGLNLKYSDELKEGFEIGPKDGSYTISFKETDFEAFIKEYLRPRMINLLFTENEG